MSRLSNLLLTGIFLLSAACSNAGNPDAVVEQAELVSRINDGSAPLILDVRSTKEYNSGHVPGATHLPYDSYQQNLNTLKLDKGREVIVYCESGGRAKKVENYLREQGFFEVRHLAGDMRGWRNAKLATEQ